MLVEFLNDDVFDLSLYVSQREYAKAKDSDDELMSLRAAIDAYMCLQGFDYFELTEELYDEFFQHMEKGSSLVIVTTMTVTIPEQRVFQILVTNNGRQRIIVDWVGDGYALVI